MSRTRVRPGSTRLLFACLVVPLLAPVPTLALPPAESPGAPESAETRLCGLIEDAAALHGLPVPFFTRLIWKESRFRSNAVSPKGAEGIAQFMPATAAARGLADPFDATAAIPASASLLADLQRRFGNLGLAAAAYNAGAQRVAAWLADDATLPWETRDYVLSITGASAEDWAANGAALRAADAKPTDCIALAALLRLPGDTLEPQVETAHGPWGVQVAGHFSRARAIAAYRALQRRHADLIGGSAPMLVSGRMRSRGTRTYHQVRVPAQSRAEAERLCRALRAAGGSCVVLKS